MLAGLYLVVHHRLGAMEPEMPPLPESEPRFHVPLPPFTQALVRNGRSPFDRAVARATRALRIGVSKACAWVLCSSSRAAGAVLMARMLGVIWQVATPPEAVVDTAGLVEAGGLVAADVKEESTGLIGAPEAEGEKSGDRNHWPKARKKPRRHPLQRPRSSRPNRNQSARWTPPQSGCRTDWLWIVFGLGIVTTAVIYRLWSWERLEVFKLLLTSFFPLAF